MICPKCGAKKDTTYRPISGSIDDSQRTVFKCATSRYDNGLLLRSESCYKKQIENLCAELERYN